MLTFLLGVLLLRLWRGSCRPNGSCWPSWVRQKQKEEKEEEGLEKQNYHHHPRAHNHRANYNDWISNNNSVSDFKILKDLSWKLKLLLIQSLQLFILQFFPTMKKLNIPESVSYNNWSDYNNRNSNYN